MRKNHPGPVAECSPASPTFVAPEFRSIPIEQLHESPLNPRRRYHDATLQELATSIGAHGVLTPLLARPTTNGGGPAFELAAGHRRLRAALLANLAELPVLVRPMSDVELVEILTIENLQREDVHPLEEAQGFADLIKHAGYDVGRIADRVGRSHRYVYDRIRLLQLTPEIQQLFFDNEITAGHAVILARLTSEQQARVLSTHGALFTSDHAPMTPAEEAADVARERDDWDEELALGDRRKPMSTRELQSWIDEHIRFDVAAPDVPELFPETRDVLDQALEQAEKIISITTEYHVDPEAKNEGERTYGPMSWKRADGRYDSKECEYAVTGVIVVGPGRGDAFRVCTAKKTCKVHWADEMKVSAQRAKQRGSSDAPAAERGEPKKSSWQIENEKREAARQAWEKLRPAVLSAIAAQVKKAAAGPKGALAEFLIGAVRDGRRHDISTFITPGSDAVDLVRYLAFIAIANAAHGYDGAERVPKIAKALGVDVAKIRKAATASEKKPAAKKKSARKNAR